MLGRSSGFCPCVRSAFPHGGRCSAVWDSPSQPLPAPTGEAFRLEPQRLYWSTLHWRPMVNGYSGYTPAPYRELARLLDDGRSAQALALLAAWNVTTVVAHLDELDDA